MSLYMEQGDGELNQQLFDHLHSQRQRLEAEIGERLVWDDMAGRKACRVAIVGDGDATDVEGREALIDWILDRHARLRNAMIPAVASFSAGE